MTLKPVIPATGMLVLVSGPDAATSWSFESVDDLRAWRPTFPVGLVQIFDNAPPVKSEGRWRYFNCGQTRVQDYDGTVVVESVSGIRGALHAYGWVYGHGR